MYTHLSRKYPYELPVLFRLGQVAYIKGNKKEAKQYFQKCIDLEPTQREVFFLMASVLSDEKKQIKHVTAC